MARQVFVVYPGALWGWEVIRDGGDEPLTFGDKGSALACARAMANVAAPAKLRLEDWYGRVEAEWEIQPQWSLPTQRGRAASDVARPHGAFSLRHRA